MRTSRIVVSLATVAALAAGSAQVAVAAPTAADAPTDQDGGTVTAAGTFVPEPITWGPCEDPQRAEAGLECGSLAVPLDHARPRGEQITLAVSRLPHQGERYQGVVVTNPGGPGGAGLDLAGLGLALPEEVGRSYDWIGMDPRGVGESSPRLQCQPEATSFGVAPPPKPRSRADYDAYVDNDRQYNADCAASSPASLLRHARTIDVARDVDTLRIALGQSQISYYGFSYGTYLGQVYATLFPERVRRMVLDGIVDPDVAWYGHSTKIQRSFQRNVNGFFRWLARHDDVYDAGSSLREVRQRFFALQDQLYDEPADGDIGGAELLYSLFDAIYFVPAFTDVASAYSDLLNDGDASGVRALQTTPSPDVDNGSAAFYAVTCTDAPWPSKVSAYDGAARRAEGAFPEIAWSLMWGNMRACRTWPAPARFQVQVDRGRGTPRALLLNETRDGPTPISGALATRRSWPGSRLVASTGASHSVSLFGIACSDTRVIDYLDTGRLPARKRGNRSDVSCPGLPAPDPSAQQRLQRSDPMPDLVREAIRDAQRLELAGLGR